MEQSFEEQYLEKGFNSQRRYPNESFISFLGTNYFSLEIKQRKEIKILELGCGSGANLWMVAKEGFDTYGIDFSPTGIKYCNEMLSDWGVTAKVEVGDFTKLQFSDNKFDVIFDVVSLQHINYKQHKQAYREIYRCLKSGGKFYSYHLGENSISLKSSIEMVDHCTLKNISVGYPLANNGQTCFLSANEVREMLLSIKFKNVVIDKIVRSYSNQTFYIEYLSITAEK